MNILLCMLCNLLTFILYLEITIDMQGYDTINTVFVTYTSADVCHVLHCAVAVVPTNCIHLGAYIYFLLEKFENVLCIPN